MAENFRKTKIYLDTSVLSYLKQDDSPERMKATLQFWEELKTRDKLKEIQFTFLTKDEDAEKLASQIIDLGILTNKSHDDCLHIAIAVLEACNYIVSWNFKHLVNVKTVNGVRAITNLKGFSPIDIITPEMLLKGDEND